LRRRGITPPWVVHADIFDGELRKLLIARARAGSPHVLLLDEVCDGLTQGSGASC
jgi:ABC-type molybdenum transport system ATPase subunit/photorepair protein PhrA